VPTEPGPAARLRALLQHPGLRPVYYRTARRALESGYAPDIEAEITAMEREITRATDATQMLQTVFPTLSQLLPCAASKPSRSPQP
jgi:hypothetical protein